MAKKKTDKAEEIVEVEVSAEAVTSEAPVEVVAEVAKPVEAKPAKTEIKKIGNTVVKGKESFAF